MLLLPCALAAWPTWAHDARRTGQSEAVGPGHLQSSGSLVLEDEAVINIPPTVDEDGRVYLGTWGVVRDLGSDDPRDWDKSDGHVFAVDRDVLAWEYAPPRVPYCYDYGDREDEACSGGTLNWQNGTVEGTAVVADGVVYIGRGDGRVYALDAETGEERWVYTTFNPEDPADPDGGGEVIGGLLRDDEGNLYFGTVAAGPYETNALYSLDRDGQLRWRYPADERGLDNLFWGGPSASPDGETLYFPGGWGPTVDDYDGTVPGRVYALDRAGNLRWTYEPVNEGAWWLPTVWPLRISVGSDGVLYVGGAEPAGFGTVAIAFALRDDGVSAALAWPGMVELDTDAEQVQGLALREVDGTTVEVLVTSGDRHNAAAGYGTGGMLASLDPANGALTWSWAPDTHGFGGSLSGLSIDAEGVIYTGVSGAGHEPGSVLALAPEGTLLWSEDLTGQLEWSHPVLGADGTLYVGDSHRCPVNALPVEDGWCDAYDMDPALTWFSGTAATPVAGPDCGCAGAGSGAAPGGVAAGTLALALLRRRPARSSAPRDGAPTCPEAGVRPPAPQASPATTRSRRPAP